MYVNYQVYRPKEKIWESYNIEEKYYDVNSVKEAFFKYCEEHGLKTDYCERAWKNRNKFKSTIYIDVGSKSKAVGFVTPAFYEKEDGKNYLVRQILSFRKNDISYDFEI